MRQAKASNIRRISEMKRARKAQMPFSVIAVLLLVLSSVSIALVYGIDDRNGRSEIPVEVLERMKSRMDDTVQEVARLAYAAALETINDAQGLNETAVRESFNLSINASLDDAYPSLDGSIRTDVEHKLKLQFLRASLEESYALYGQDMATWEGASVPAYFVIYGNYSINVSCPQGHLNREVEMDQEVYVPLPLLMYRLDRLSRTAVPRGELESVVRYELSALAQDRVLRGYGSGAKTGAESTVAVITEEDVIRAINLALVLEELRYFQDAGSTGNAELDEATSDLYGTIDPADLFLASYGEGSIDLAPIVAQALTARADAITLKWLDYFGIINLLNLAEDIYEWGKQTLTDTIDFLTGGDSDQAAITEYVTNAMIEAGFQQYDYRWFSYGHPDCVVILPDRKMCLIDDQGGYYYYTFHGKYNIDFLAVDLFSSPEWGELNRQFRSETHAAAEALKSYLQVIATGVASHCSLPVVSLTLDPTDGKNYLEEIDEQIREAFREGSSWLRPAIDRASELADAREGLAQGVMDFLDRRWKELFRMNESMYHAAEGLSWTLAYQLNGTEHFSEATIAKVQQRVFADLLGDYWGAKEEIESIFQYRAGLILEKLQQGLSQKTVGGNGFIEGLICDGISSIPGIDSIMTGSALDTIVSIMEGFDSQGGGVLIPISNCGIELRLADGQQRVEEFKVSSVAVRMGAGSEVGCVDVMIKEPWQYDRANSSYPNRHVTNLLEMTSTPYLTQWGVEYHGSVKVTVSAREGSGINVPTTALISLDGSFSIIAFSGWGLKGVVYDPTTTLREDIRDFLVKAWDFLCSAVTAVGGLIAQAFNFFSQLVSDLLAYATRPLEVLNQLLTSALEAIKDVSTDLLGNLIGALADTASAILGGTTIHLSILGVTVSLIIGPSDSALIGAEDRIRADLVMSVPGATITSSVRVLRLSDGDHTIAGTVSIGGDDWSADITLDPLTKVYEHQVEVRGYMGGHILEIVAPEVERVQKASFALSDIPLLSTALQSIPSPVPGTKFSLDAGMELSFNVLDRRTVLINEVELNPAGKDHSREWVELFNPSDHAVDVTGWSLATSRGQQHIERLDGTIPAHGYLVHRFTGQALDNGEVKGFPLEESVVLLDASGKRIDSAPWLKDLGNDDRSWQRSFDGSSRWEMRDASEGASNGLVLLSEIDTSGLVDLIADCFMESFGRFVDEGMDIATLDDIITDALLRLRDRLLDMVEATVSSISFFVKLGLADATGSAGGGLKMALVYDGRAVRACLDWLIDAVGEVLRDPLNPLAAGLRAEVPVEALADHVYVQVGAYVSIGAPDMIGKIKVSATAVIKVSLRTLGLFEGNGDWELSFGLVISGVHELKAMGAKISTGGCYDVWAMRGSLRPA